MEHILSNSMVAMYVQGLSSQAFSNEGASSPNSQSYADVPSATVGTITPRSYYPSTIPQVNQVPYNAPPPPQTVPPSPPTSFPYNAHVPIYDFGYTGSTNSFGSSLQNSMSPQQFSFQQRPYYGGSQRNNGGYKYNKDIGNNGGYKQGGWTSKIDSQFNMQPECYICQRRGHTAPNCFHKNSASHTNFIEC